ncbi:nuclear speckle splicing regulatory protein 1 [Pseudomyrmex gracilis]|uniref:nuclear speckle splicing regulatory protein 1 n=1 Tax=Pseudomyrmex gracilis TaxID=219809 RepID=UPI000995B574|nr:nuclear speckle splicing regulatory protein 1 [Pseudomyrmex gracilis]
MTSNKQYGLILPKKQQQTTPKLGNVFGDDNASDDDEGTDWVKKALRVEGEKHKMKKQTKLDIQKALNEDPTIYQYDEVYDDLERTRCQSEINKQKVKKPKYIQNLLKTAEQRKKEQEHRIERMVQKEREAEGEMYVDKESFVTSAYRAKLEEFKKMEEEEARISRLEAIADVTKQQDMSGFYRHLYKQTVDSQDNSNEYKNSETEKTNIEQVEERTLTNNKEKDNLTKNKTNNTDTKLKGITKSKTRQYRQRMETCDSDSEPEPSKEEVKNEQSVLSTEKSVNKSGIQEFQEKKDTQDKHNINTDENSTDIKLVSTKNTENKESNIMDVEISHDHKIVDLESEKEKFIEKKDKTSIYAKRTTGSLFEAALQRYYARKAKKLAAIHQV